MKGLEIYRTSKFYKIVTMYRRESGAYMLSKPIYIVSIEKSIEELSNAIFSSLEASRSIKESEEDNLWLGNKLLKELKERSFNNLYKNSTSCCVFFNKKGLLSKGMIEIEPYKYSGKDEGLEAIEEEIVKIKYNNNTEDAEITKIIIEILEKG